MKSFIDNIPSAIYRLQIKNIASRMRYLVTQTILYPLKNMAPFNKVNANFTTIKDEANLCCSVMDTAKTIENEDRAINATTTLMQEMVNLKNEATSLIQNEPINKQHSRPPLE